MSNIEKIKAEIERLKEDIPCHYHPYACASVSEAYDNLLAFIDSLPEEKPSKDLEEEIQKAIDKYPLNKEDMSEDEIATYHQGLIFGARHFAEWGAKHLK